MYLLRDTDWVFMYNLRLFSNWSSKIFIYMNTDFVLHMSGFAVFIRKHQKFSFDLRIYMQNGQNI